MSGVGEPAWTAAARWLDSGRLAVFFLLLFPAVSGLRGRIEDADLWWHLRQGAWMLENRSVVWEDVFSYTATGRPSIAYSWLAEIFFHVLVDRFGLVSMIWLQTAVAVAGVGFVYLACRASGARLTVAVPVSALAAISMSFAWGIRPVIFTLLFLSILSWALREPKAERHLVWIAPAVTALWANVHILFVAGVALVGFAAVCRELEGAPSRSLRVACGLAALATLATPYGGHLVAYVAVMARQPAIVPEVGEFQSPDFGGELGLAFGALLFPAVIVIALSRRRMSLFELGTFLGSLAVGLMAKRNMALFAILAAPVVARHLEAILPPSKASRVSPRPAFVAVNVLLAAFGVAYLASQAPRAGDVVRGGELPVRAVDYLLESHPGARLFNDFNWGGYVMYRGFPAMRVSIDGRTQVYEHLLRAYMRTHFLEPGWEELLRECDPEVILWPAGGSLATALRQDPAWEVAFEDPIAVVFRRRGPEAS